MRQNKKLRATVLILSKPEMLQMFIDTSAFVAILAGESEAGPLADTIAAAARKVTSAVVRLETCIVLATRLDVSIANAERAFDRLLQEAVIEVMPVTDDVGRAAVDAYARYGKGRRHQAQLNFADCLSYASAKMSGMPLLFIGNDFGRTDILDARLPRSGL